MDVEESINILTGLAEIEQYFAEIASAKEKQAEREARAELKGMAREINYRYWNRPLDIEVIYSDDLPKYTLGRCGSGSVGWG